MCKVGQRCLPRALSSTLQYPVFTGQETHCKWQLFPMRIRREAPRGNPVPALAGPGVTWSSDLLDLIFRFLISSMSTPRPQPLRGDETRHQTGMTPYVIVPLLPSWA